MSVLCTSKLLLELLLGLSCGRYILWCSRLWAEVQVQNIRGKDCRKLMGICKYTKDGEETVGQ
jgi:hypothetical protein